MTATGHAAIGSIVGQRCPDGSRPDRVEIEYLRRGDTYRAEIHPTSATTEIGMSTGETIRVDLAAGGTALVDELLSARPLCDD